MSDNTPIPRFAERLKSARIIRDMTQAAVTADAGLPNAYISLLEHGVREPSIRNLRKLVLTLGVSADYLLGISDNPVNQSGSSTLGGRIQCLGKRDVEVVEMLVSALEGRDEARRR